MNPTSAQSSDFERITALLIECHLPTQDITLKHLRHFFILQDRGKLIGVIGLEVRTEFGLLRSLAVKEPFRGQRLGKQLVAHAEVYAETLGVQRIYLLTTTAEQFFLSLEYTATNREQTPLSIQNTPEFSKICPTSSVCMVKQIN
jgi:amino-acid N-acetyltransferase